MITRKATVLVIIIFICQFAYGFDDQYVIMNPGMKRPFGLSFDIASGWLSRPTLFSGTMHYMLIPQLDLQGSVSVDFMKGPYFYGGSRIQFTSIKSTKKLTPFTGIYAGVLSGDFFYQIPLGLSYLSNSGSNLSFSLNKRFSYYSSKNSFFELGIGWRF
jgi:hypothetical protein